MITIRHTHAHGTTLTGSRPGDGVLQIVRRHGWAWRRYAGIHIPQSRDRFSFDLPIEMTAQALRDAGHDVEVDIDETWRPAAVREAGRARRVDARVDRLDGRAGSAARRSAAARARVDRIADGIPFGQPILVGHHSEGKARRDQARMDAGMRRSLAEAEYAGQLAGRAGGARRNEDAKHHPRAIARRIEELEAGIRRRERYLAGPDVTAAGRAWTLAHLERDREDVAHQRAKLAALAHSGEHVAWQPQHFVRGDEVNVGGLWLPVRRVNRKSVSVPGGYGHAGDDASWSQTVPWDNVHGRRRDGRQLDRPNGQPWPVDQADRVARWRDLLHRASSPTSRYTDQARHVRWAQRIAHRLDLDAADAEVTACQPATDDMPARRELASAYLTIYDRLTADEPAAAVIASTPMVDIAAAWRLPDGEPQHRRADLVRPGDLVKGCYDRGIGSELWRTFAGPVTAVSDVEHHRERGDWVTITLADGTAGRFETHRWLAVFPAAGADGTDTPTGDPSAR